MEGVDLVLGMSMAPSTVRMVLVEGKNGDGATVDQDGFPVATAANTGNEPTLTAANQAMAAILGTREGAAQDQRRYRAKPGGTQQRVGDKRSGDVEHGGRRQGLEAVAVAA